jgi:hypothetical protein
MHFHWRSNTERKRAACVSFTPEFLDTHWPNATTYCFAATRNIIESASVGGSDKPARSGSVLPTVTCGKQQSDMPLSSKPRLRARERGSRSSQVRKWMWAIDRLAQT